MSTFWNNFTTTLSNTAFAHWLQTSDILRLTPKLPWKLMWPYVAFVGICFVGGIVISFLKVHPALRDRISSFLWTNAILGLALFFFRYQVLPIVGMDIWRLLQEVASVIWAALILRYALTDFKKLRRAEQAVAYKEKYLPKAKR